MLRGRRLAVTVVVAAIATVGPGSLPMERRRGRTSATSTRATSTPPVDFRRGLVGGAIQESSSMRREGRLKDIEATAALSRRGEGGAPTLEGGEGTLGESVKLELLLLNAAKLDAGELWSSLDIWATLISLAELKQDTRELNKLTGAKFNTECHIHVFPGGEEDSSRNWSNLVEGRQYMRLNRSTNV